MTNKYYHLPQLSVSNSIASMAILSVCSFPSYSFELLTEGAMDSVSAVSGPIVTGSAFNDSVAKKNALSSRTQMTADGYEKLPFETNNLLQPSDANEVSLDLDYAFTSEAENWAEKLRVDTDERFEISVTDVVPFSKFEVVNNNFFGDFSRDVRIIPIQGGPEDGEYQLGKLDQTIDTFFVEHNSISYEVNSHVDFAATINSQAYPEDGLSFGNVYLTDINATGRQTVTQR